MRQLLQMIAIKRYRKEEEIILKDAFHNVFWSNLLWQSCMKKFFSLISFSHHCITFIINSSPAQSGCNYLTLCLAFQLDHLIYSRVISFFHVYCGVFKSQISVCIGVLDGILDANLLAVFVTHAHRGCPPSYMPFSSCLSWGDSQGRWDREDSLLPQHIITQIATHHWPPLPVFLTGETGPNPSALSKYHHWADLHHTQTPGSYNRGFLLWYIHGL